MSLFELWFSQDICSVVGLLGHMVVLFLVLHREISSVLCDHLEEWDREGGRATQEGGDIGIYVYIQLIHLVIQQRLTQHCKAIICQ